MWGGGFRSWGADVVAFLATVVLAVYLLSGAEGWNLVAGLVLFGVLAVNFAIRAHQGHRDWHAARRRS